MVKPSPRDDVQRVRTLKIAILQAVQSRRPAATPINVRDEAIDIDTCITLALALAETKAMIDERRAARDQWQSPGRRPAPAQSPSRWWKRLWG